MREIKFRLWQYDSFSGDKMVYLNETYIGIGQLGFSNTHYIDLNDMDHEHVEIMQYTGLKDKNGVEIYEGDIVKVLSTPPFLTVAEFKDGAFFPVSSKKVREKAGFEVIGNIYENKELINRGKSNE